MLDKLGKQVKLGTRVAYSSHYNRGLTLGTITRVGRVRVYVTPEAGSWRSEVESFHSTDVVKV